LRRRRENFQFRNFKPRSFSGKAVRRMHQIKMKTVIDQAWRSIGTVRAAPARGRPWL
jgi:hypothetical protein